MSSEEYAASNVASASYRPKGYGISPGLQRARRPFRFRNAVTGVAIASFGVGVWAYSISAVKQDVFDDVDEEARALNAATGALQRPPPPTRRLSGATSAAVGDVPQQIEEAKPRHTRDGITSERRGLLFAALGNKHPWLFDPIHKTLVWGAPPVDRIGRIEDKVLVYWRR